MSIKGWFPDPSGRFSQRWYDGHRWSDQVVAANGATIDDPLPETDRPYPPPMPTQVVPPAPVASPVPPAGQPPVPPPGLPPVPAGPPPFAPAAQPASPRPSGPPSGPPPRPGAPAARLRPGATLGIGLFGLVVAAASLLGVPWVNDGPGVSFLDISEGARDASGDGELLVRSYAIAGGFVLFVLALVAVVLAGLPVPRHASGAAAMRVAATCVCGLAAVLHTVTVVRIFRGPATPDVGAWLGTVGYFIAIAGLVVGHYRRSGPA